MSCKAACYYNTPLKKTYVDEASVVTDLKNKFVNKLNLLNKVLFSEKTIYSRLIFEDDFPFCDLWGQALGKLQYSCDQSN